MKRLVQTVALGAALLALAFGVWRDLDALMTLRRAALAYLVAYFLAAIAVLGCRAALRGVRDPDPEPEPEPADAGRRSWRSRPAGGESATPPPAAVEAAAESEPEPVDHA